MLPAGVKSDGQVNQLAGAVVVKWSSTYIDKLHQVYVNGKFAGATLDANQRQMVAPVPLSQKYAVRIKIFAVEPEFADIDFSELLNTENVQAGRVKLEFARTGNLPMEGNVDYYSDSDTVNNRAIRIWSELANKDGFGLGSFGNSDFGFDGSAAIGFGKGSFGVGCFGFDADSLRWQSSQLDKGNYKFGISINDAAGNTADMVETGEMVVIPPATPAERLLVDSFDKQNGKIVLKVE